MANIHLHITKLSFGVSCSKWAEINRG